LKEGNFFIIDFARHPAKVALSTLRLGEKFIPHGAKQNALSLQIISANIFVKRKLSFGLPEDCKFLASKERKIKKIVKRICG
jgi:hypothetical protein